MILKNKEERDERAFQARAKEHRLSQVKTNIDSLKIGIEEGLKNPDWNDSKEHKELSNLLTRCCNFWLVGNFDGI